MQGFKRNSLMNFMPVIIVIGFILNVFLICNVEQKNYIKIPGDFVVFLTMAIDPGKTINVERNNIKQRIKDYQKSLAQWAKLPYKVIVVENTGYGNPFTDILANAPHITYVSIVLPQEPTRGKGYGEAQIINYAMQNLITDNNLYIMKVTGRYAPLTSLQPLINTIRIKNINTLMQKKPEHPEPWMEVGWQPSEWYIAPREFHLALANDCIEHCDDHQAENNFEARLDLQRRNFNAYNYTRRLKVVPTYTGSQSILKTEI